MPTPHTPIHHSRRTLLKSGLLATSGLALSALTSCTGSGGEPTEPTDGRPVAEAALPQFLPFEGVEPKYPASVDGGIQGFLGYPHDPVSEVPEPPGGGATIQGLIALGGKAQVPYDSNKYWQQLNKNLDATLNLTTVPRNQLSAKVSTTIAGNDLPDIMQIPQELATDLPSLLEAKFQDLTPFLGGDKIAKYPYLANFPTNSWLSSAYNGKVFGIPSVARLLERYLVIRKDLAEKHGWNQAPADKDDMMELFTAMAAVSKDSFAGTAKQLFKICLPMFGAPNGWREEDDGSFVLDIETDEYKDTLAYLAKVWSAGLCHPNSFLTGQQILDWFGTGVISTYSGIEIGYSGMLKKYHSLNPEMDLGFVPIPQAGGGGPAPSYLSSGRHTMSVIKKAEPEAIERILSVLNYLAGPFGTKEYLFMKYGVEGVHFKWDGDTPIANERGNKEYMGHLSYLAKAPSVLFWPNYPQVTERDWANEKLVIQKQVPPGDLGLYSATQAQDGPKLLRDVTSQQWEVIQGKATMADWDATVRKWQTGGGDTIRDELAASRDAT